MAVNLSPSDRKQDVYTVVLEIVKRKVRNEVEKGGVNAELAARLESLDVLKRKVVKQTIMTICYGVTTIGAKQQVQRQLEDLLGKQVDPKEISLMARYLSGLVLKSIDEVFEKAMTIKRWFDKVSKILYSFESPVSWLSPIGLACAQPYRKMKTVSVATKRQKLSMADFDGPMVDKTKQRMGFPPNFIHSLDASHMMLVAEGCSLEGLYFAGVHDSFWTHAADTPALNRIIRSAFVELHERPLLEELHRDLCLHVGNLATIPDLPDQGSLDISQVIHSDYIFS